VSLQSQLNALKAQFEARAQPDALAVMHRATEELRRSGILERVLKVGDKAPDFALPDGNGTIVSSKDLLAKGPLIVSFYRGVW
jgi:AhpC/TSA family protein